MKQIIQRALLLSVLLCSFGFSLTPALVSADTKADITSGVDTAAGSSGGSADPTPIVHSIVSILAFVVGIVAVVVIIIAGLNFITAGGDSGKITRARTMILYAVVGLVVAALAEVIVRYVLNKTP